MKERITIPSDDQLVQLLQHKTSEGQGILHLYSQYSRQLNWYVMQNGGSEADSRDIFQEVVLAFVHMVQEGKFRGESSVKTILFSLNRFMWLNELKKRGRTAEREKKFGSMSEQIEPSASAAVEEHESRKQLMQIMDELGENCKKILLLFYYENYSMKEIVGKLDYENEQVVRNRKYKCLKKLEEMIHSREGLFLQLKNLLHG